VKVKNDGLEGNLFVQLITLYRRFRL